VARGWRHRRVEQEPRWRRRRRAHVGATLAAELAPHLAELHAQITGTKSAVDQELLVQLLSEGDYCAGTDVVRERLSTFIALHRQRVRGIHRDYLGDPRRPGVLDDGCCLLVFEGLERDRFTLRARWPATREEAELRQLAAIWGTPIS